MSKSRPVIDEEFENLVSAILDLPRTPDLSGASLSGANLSGANLSNAKLNVSDDGWDEFEAYMNERDKLTEEDEEARLDALLQTQLKKDGDL